MLVKQLKRQIYEKEREREVKKKKKAQDNQKYGIKYKSEIEERWEGQREAGEK